MDSKEQLKNFVNNFIKGEHDEATDALNSAIEIKTRKLVGTEPNDLESDSDSESE